MVLFHSDMQYFSLCFVSMKNAVMVVWYQMNEECKKYGIVSDFNLEKSSEQYIFAHIRGSREE